MSNIPAYFMFPLTIIIAGIISHYAVRKIIFISHHRRIYDIPDNVRKIHGDHIASLGGIGIFAGYLVASSIFMHREWYYIMAASVILFFTGIYDDIMNMRPSKKLMAQLLAASIAVVQAHISIDNTPFSSWIPLLPNVVYQIATIFSCAFFINVFNFVDGIDGLACSLAILYSTVLGLLFYYSGASSLAGISFCLAGATIGLLAYNWAPARIYMGDTGSMLLGFTIFTLAILCASTPHSATSTGILSASAKSAIIIGLLFYPCFDAVRVFTIRLASKQSPLAADRRHFHHYLLDTGASHPQAVLIILSINLALIAFSWWLQSSLLLLVLCLTIICILVTAVVSQYRKTKLKTA